MEYYLEYRRKTYRKTFQRTLHCTFNSYIKSSALQEFSEEETRDYFKKNYQGLDDKTYTVFCNFLPCLLSYFTFLGRKFSIVLFKSFLVYFIIIIKNLKKWMNPNLTCYHPPHYDQFHFSKIGQKYLLESVLQKFDSKLNIPFRCYMQQQPSEGILENRCSRKNMFFKKQ